MSVLLEGVAKPVGPLGPVQVLGYSGEFSLLPVLDVLREFSQGKNTLEFIDAEGRVAGAMSWSVWTAHLQAELYVVVGMYSARLFQSTARTTDCSGVRVLIPTCTLAELQVWQFLQAAVNRQVFWRDPAVRVVCPTSDRVIVEGVKKVAAWAESTWDSAMTSCVPRLCAWFRAQNWSTANIDMFLEGLLPGVFEDSVDWEKAVRGKPVFAAAIQAFVGTL